MAGLIKNLFDENKKSLKKYNKDIIEIKNNSENLLKEGLTQEQVKNKLKEIQSLFSDLDLEKEENLKKAEKILQEQKKYLVALIYAATKSMKGWKLIPYDTQLIGILSILDNNLVEMQTGEGKSLVSFLAGLIKSLVGLPINIISINHFLIERDYNEFKSFAEYCGISIGVITDKLEEDKKRIEYSKNIVYSTHQDIIFDYLKDNMFLDINKILIKHFYFAIIDEIDAILIDSALTPIMFSIPTKHNTLQFMEYHALATKISKNKEYFIIDKETKSIELTKEGVVNLESLINVENIYISKYFKYIEGVQNALKAIFIFKNKEDYIIVDNKIVIIDSTTGRPIEGRTFPTGIHQAIETKEGLKISKENKILASITYQNFFKLFYKFSGLSGTIKTEEDEFFNVYNTKVISIPRLQKENKTFMNDLFFKSYKGKMKFLVEYIKEINESGQPLLIGAPSVERAEELYSLLNKENIIPNIITAANHKEEAEIIKEAGNVGKITIVTTMAGRGTDIKVSKEANELGGLFVIGLERGQSRRIDNQLSGRVGRQGDYGTVLFLISPEDTIITQTDKQEGLESVFERFYGDKEEDESIQANNMIVSAILKLQAFIENENYNTRKYLLQYDQSLTIHRNIFYKKRKELLKISEIKNIENVFIDNIKELYKVYSPIDEDRIEIFDILNNKSELINDNELDKYVEEKVKLFRLFLTNLKDKLQGYYKEILVTILLNNVDNNWSKHLTKMSDLKTELAFVSYQQRDPIAEYNSHAYKAFEDMQYNVKKDNIKLLYLLHNSKDTIIDKKSILDLIGNFGKEDNKQNEYTKPLSREELIWYWEDIKQGGFINFNIPEILRPKRKHELKFIWNNILKNGFIDNSILYNNAIVEGTK